MRLALGLVLCVVALAAAWPLSPAKGGSSNSGGYVSTTYPQGPCRPNTSVKYLCNDCNCDSNGLGYTCTRRECGNQRPTGPQISPPRPFPDQPQIQPIRPKPGGPQVQPPRPNPGGPQVQPPRPNPGGPQVQPPRPYPGGPQIQPPKPPRECTPGTNFLAPDGCNTCRCTSTGIAACTRKECIKKCTPGSNFRSPDGCNTCTCTSTGVEICTQKDCFPIPPPPAKQ